MGAYASRGSPRGAARSSTSSNDSMAVAPPSGIPKSLLESLSEAITNATTYLKVATESPNLNYAEKNLLASLVSLQSNIAVLNPVPQQPVFPKFGKLPQELRLMVWKLAGSIGRVVGVHMSFRGGEIQLEGNAARCQLLLTCKESRDEARKLKNNFNASNPGGAKIYANFSIDTIWLQGMGSTLRGSLSNEVIRQIIGSRDGNKAVEKLAVDVHSLRRSYSYSFHRDNKWPYTMDLKELVFVLTKETKNSTSSRTRLVDPRQTFKDHVAQSPEENKELWYETSESENWEDVAREYEQQLENEIASHQLCWSDLLAEGIDAEYLACEGIRDLTNWVVPRISFMEITDNIEESAVLSEPRQTDTS